MARRSVEVEADILELPFPAGLRRVVVEPLAYDSEPGGVALTLVMGDGRVSVGLTFSQALRVMGAMAQLLEPGDGDQAQVQA